PCLRSSASTASMPFLSIVRRARLDRRSFTQRFSLATHKRRSRRLGSQRRQDLLLACSTFIPICPPFLLTSHTRAMTHLEGSVVSPLARETAAPPPWAVRDTGHRNRFCGIALPLVFRQEPDKASRALCQHQAHPATNLSGTSCTGFLN